MIRITRKPITGPTSEAIMKRVLRKVKENAIAQIVVSKIVGSAQNPKGIFATK